MHPWFAALVSIVCLAGPARAADMRVHIGGHTYDLPRALDDGGSDAPDPAGPPRETILLRANAPGITPRTDQDFYNPAPLFSQDAVEILGQAVADAPGQPVTAEKERSYMRDTLRVQLTLAHQMPSLTLVSPELAPGQHPSGEHIRFVQAPKPWDPSFPKLFLNGPEDSPEDVLACGGGECQHWFLYRAVIWKLTYGEHLVAQWNVIRANLKTLLDHAEVHTWQGH